MWAIGRYDLRLTSEEFWSLSLRETFLLIDRWDAAEQRQDRRAAIAPCILANVHRGKDQKPYKIEDFMPGGRKKQTVEDHMALLEAVTKAFGGTVN